MYLHGLFSSSIAEYFVPIEFHPDSVGTSFQGQDHLNFPPQLVAFVILPSLFSEES